jgi:hypothetical protein
MRSGLNDRTFRACRFPSSILTGIDAEFSHARQKRGPIDAYARGSAIHPTYATLALRECTDDFLALPLSASVPRVLVAAECINGFLYNLRNVLPF